MTHFSGDKFTEIFKKSFRKLLTKRFGFVIMVNTKVSRAKSQLCGDGLCFHKTNKKRFAF